MELYEVAFLLTNGQTKVSKLMLGKGTKIYNIQCFISRYIDTTGQVIQLGLHKTHAVPALQSAECVFLYPIKLTTSLSSGVKQKLEVNLHGYALEDDYIYLSIYNGLGSSTGAKIFIQYKK